MATLPTLNGLFQFNNLTEDDDRTVWCMPTVGSMC